MAVTHYTITANFADLLGAAYPTTGSNKAVVVAWLETNIAGSEGVVDSLNDLILLGPSRQSADSSGLIEWADVIGSDSDAADINLADGTLQYRVTAEYVNALTRKRGERWSSGWFSLTADVNLADVVAEQYAPASWQTSFMEQAQEYLDAQSEISGLTGEDAAVGGLLGNDLLGPLTRAAARDLVTGDIEDSSSDVFGALADFTDVRSGRIFTPEQYGAVGNGVADDTAAVRACFNAANTAARAGLAGTIVQPGAAVVLRGIYKLTTLAAPIDMTCNVLGAEATFIVPDAYAGVAVRVGNPANGQYLQNADINVPDVLKAGITTSAGLVAGSIGVRIMNIGNSRIRLQRTCYFETGVNCSGDGQGTAYNVIDIGWISYCKISLSLKPHTASGWCNHNAFVGGSMQQSPSFGGGIRQSGWRHVVIDGSAGQYVNGNNFYGTSFEGDVSEYWLYAKSAADIQFDGTRHEQGTAGVPVTVSGDTLTKVGHGLSAGDMVTFSATVAPTGMVVAAPYYVLSTGLTADVFKVSFKKGGTAVTFSSSGTSVSYFRPPRAYFELGGILQNINVEHAMTQQNVMEVVKSTTGGSNLLYRRPGWHLTDTYSPEDIPLNRARNSSAASGLNRVVYAAYPAAANPVEDPFGWTTGLSDLGVMFATNGAVTGLIKVSSTGVIQFNLNGGTTNYELATCIRSQTATTLSSGTTYTAGTRTSGTATLTNASTGDYVAWTNSAGGAIPRGLVISARVSSSNTITYDIDNNTAADITLAANITLFFKATRRFF